MLFLFYFVMMLRPISFTAFVLFFLCLNLSAQNDVIPFVKQATKENREKEYRSLLTSIAKNLSIPLTDSTEADWQDAFGAMELINYHSATVDAKIKSAFDFIEKRSVGFQWSYLELIYTNYPKEFVPQIVSFLKKTQSPKFFAMCSEYLFMNNRLEEYKPLMLKRMKDTSFNANEVRPFFTVLQNKLANKHSKNPPLKDFLKINFLPKEIVLFSFQRKNRNYPGLAMVRGKDGLYIKDEKGNYFAVPQLARSITNMPGYLTNGNTPQGIFKVTGFDVSTGSFIGPTTNIQMVLPYEKSPDVADSVTQSLGDNYRFLLPKSWKYYYPFFEAYYAGKAGRSEIIAHGTTVNPEYYKKQPYYPISPTQGCLCTKEIWSAVDGKRLESDQQKLVNAVKKAGGADGYCVVIEIDDQQKPVTIKDILPYLNKKIK